METSCSRGLISAIANIPADDRKTRRQKQNQDILCLRVFHLPMTGWLLNGDLSDLRQTHAHLPVSDAPVSVSSIPTYLKDKKQETVRLSGRNGFFSDSQTVSCFQAAKRRADCRQYYHFLLMYRRADYPCHTGYFRTASVQKLRSGYTFSK